MKTGNRIENGEYRKIITGLIRSGKSFLVFSLFFILSSIFLLPVPSAHAWYDTAWQYREKITVNPVKVGSGGVTNFPMLFSERSPDLRFTDSGGKVASSTAGEIVFTDANENKLSHEIESYTSTTGELVAWVKVPFISSTSTTVLYIYYGNSTVTTYQATTTGVWTNSYAGVYHLGEGDSTATDFYKDSTSNARHGTLTDTDGDSTSETGKIGLSIELEGDNDFIGGFSSPTFGSPASITASAWVNLFGVTNSLSRAEVWNIGDNVNIWLNSTGCCGTGSEGYFVASNLSGNRIPTSGPTVSLNTWHHLVYTVTNGTQKFYIDNVEIGSGTVALEIGWGLGDYTGVARLGEHSGGALADVEGRIDEARVASTNRSAAWVATEYNNQSSPQSFYSYGTWPYRKKISINPAQVGSGGVTDFPMLFSVTDSDLRFTDSGGHVASSTAGEIRFTDADGNKLDHEIESYTSTTGALVAWVKVPSISSSAPTTLYIHYGNANASYQPTNSAVWSNGYAGVYHLGDGDSTAASFYRDSTSNARHSTLTDANGNSAQATGQVGNGMYFTTDDDYITFPTGYFGSPSAMTISAWVNSTTTPNNTLDRYEIFNIGDHVNMWLDCNGGCGTSASQGYWWYEPALAVSVPSTGPTVEDTGWRYVTFSGANGSQVFYLDGVSQGSNTIADTPDWANAAEPSRLGQHQGGNLASYDGLIDEARISTTNRSAAWTLTEFNNQSSPTTFYSYGNEDKGQQGRLSMPQNYLRSGSGLIGYWTFNGKDMTPNVRDISGQGNHGNLQGQTSTTTAVGKIGQALTFDGTDDYVTMGDVLDPGTGDYSTFAWVKTSATFTGQVISKRDGDTSTNAGTHLFLNSTTMSAILSDGSASRIRVDSTAPVINDGVWHHVGVTYDRDGNLQIYVDGVPATGGSASISAQQSSINNAIALTIGRENNGSGNCCYWNGQIDDVRVYNRALSAAEVANLYRVGGAKVNSSQNSKVTSGLVGLWSFNGPDVNWGTNKALDRSGQGNDGTLKNMATSTSPAIGKLGQALTFDGTDDYITATAPSALSNASVFSVAFWAKAPAYGLNPNAVVFRLSTYADATTFHFLPYDDANGNGVRIRFNGANIININSGAPVSTNWNHFVYVQRSATDRELFINSASVVTETTSKTLAAVTTMEVGSLQGTGQYYNGQLDDVRVYSRALSAAEILQLYQMGAAKVLY